MNLAEIRTLLRARLTGLSERYGVRLLAVFGSRLRGEERPESDLDLLVDFDRTPSLFRFLRLEEELSDLLGVRVDLVMRSALKPRIGARILDEAVSV